MIGDTEHEIVKCPTLKRGELHRFKNKAGQEYSAIYFDGVEIFSCERHREKGMIEHANDDLPAMFPSGK